jgi:hypothetical protein
MFRTVLVAALLLPGPALAAAPAQPPGRAPVVFPYPAKAPIVVCLNGYEKARDRLNMMLAAALPKDADRIAKALDDELRKLAEGRKLDAVRKDARVFLVVNDLAALFEDSPAVSVLVPVTSYKAFLETALTAEELGTLDRGKDGVDAFKTSAPGEETPAFLVDLKNYVVLTLDRVTAEGYAGKYDPASAEALGPELADSFLKADAAALVNMDQINDLYGDQIRAVRGLVDFGLMQAQQEGLLAGLDQKQIEAAKVLLKGAFQGIEDCRAVVLAAEFKAEGLVVRLQARFAENTPSWRLLGEEPVGRLAEVGRLPGGLGTYQATRFGPTLADLLRGMALQFSTTDDDRRGAELIDQHLQDLAAAGPRGEYAASAAGGVGVTVTEYADASKAARALSKVYKAVAAGGRVNGVIVKAAPRVQDEAETYRKFTFTQVTLRYDLDATVAALPEEVRGQTLESLKRTVSERTTLWIGTDGKVVVQLIAGGWEAARGMLDSYLDGKPAIGDEAGFKLTRSHLPDEANLLLIGETAATLTALADSLRAMQETIPDLPRIPTLKPGKAPPTYVGGAVTLKGDMATVTVFVPGTAMEAARTLLDALFKNIE